MTYTVFGGTLNRTQPSVSEASRIALYKLCVLFLLSLFDLVAVVVVGLLYEEEERKTNEACGADKQSEEREACSE